MAPHQNWSNEKISDLSWGKLKNSAKRLRPSTIAAEYPKEKGMLEMFSRSDSISCKCQFPHKQEWLVIWDCLVQCWIPCLEGRCVNTDVGHCRSGIGGQI